jgi:hypothetical protein
MTDLAEDRAPARQWDGWLRRAFPLVAWLFVGCILVQFFLVGMAVFEVELFAGLHGDFAYLYGWLTPILVLLAARAGSPHALRLAGALLVLFAIQTFLPMLADVAPSVAALHALNALVVGWLALQLAQTASKLPGADGTARR